MDLSKGSFAPSKPRAPSSTAASALLTPTSQPDRNPSTASPGSPGLPDSSPSMEVPRFGRNSVPSRRFFGGGGKGGRAGEEEGRSGSSGSSGEERRKAKKRRVSELSEQDKEHAGRRPTSGELMPPPSQTSFTRPKPTPSSNFSSHSSAYSLGAKQDSKKRRVSLVGPFSDAQHDDEDDDPFSLNFASTPPTTAAPEEPEDEEEVEPHPSKEIKEESMTPYPSQAGRGDEAGRRGRSLSPGPAPGQHAQDEASSPAPEYIGYTAQVGNQSDADQEMEDDGDLRSVDDDEESVDGEGDDSGFVEGFPSPEASQESWTGIKLRTGSEEQAGVEGGEVGVNGGKGVYEDQHPDDRSTFSTPFSRGNSNSNSTLSQPPQVPFAVHRADLSASDTPSTNVTAAVAKPAPIDPLAPLASLYPGERRPHLTHAAVLANKQREGAGGEAKTVELGKWEEKAGEWKKGFAGMTDRMKGLLDSSRARHSAHQSSLSSHATVLSDISHKLDETRKRLSSWAGPLLSAGSAAGGGEDGGKGEPAAAAGEAGRAQ